MHKAKPIQELDRYLCLLCDEAFFLAAEEALVCPKCGNTKEDAFTDAEPEEADDTTVPEVEHVQ